MRRFIRSAVSREVKRSAGDGEETTTTTSALMMLSEIDDDGCTNSPARKQRVAVPVSNVILRPIDHAPGELVLGSDEIAALDEAFPPGARPRSLPML